MEYVYGAKDFDTAVEIGNYPWGFRLRTKVRYWIETTNRGDRFVKCTLNPKTNQWCKPKKSTYDAVMVMTKKVEDDKTFINYTSISVGWSNPTQVAHFEHDIDRTQLSNKQLKQICKCKAVNEMNKNVKWEIKKVNTYNLSDPADLARMKADANSPQELKRKKEQKDIEEKILGYGNHLYNQCLIKNNLGGK